ncbi:MAG: serine hydrolase [Saprospiraceae bacterium]|nr:serine hydrolase [Saprospiraceae bacterium]
MRKTFFSFLAFLLITCLLPAQADYTGRWNGAIEVPGSSLELSIDLSMEDGHWKGSLDIPVQRIKDMALADMVIEGRDMRFKLPEVPGNAQFEGKFDEKAERLEGSFMQSGMLLSMKLMRESAAAQADMLRQRQEALATLRHLTDSLRQLRLMPGLAFGIVQDGEVLMAEGFGYRDLEKKLPVTANTQFAIGSSSKAFTAACLAILADRDQLDWDKPVINYMPDFRLYDEFSTQEMTAVDLVCHRSGLPRHDLMWYGSPNTRKEIYDRLRYLQPNKSLRTAWQYNNLMFMTAGYLVERISGKTWEAFVQQNIFAPLGMTNSNFSVKDMAAAKDAATGYRTKDRKENIRMEYRNIDAVGPAGSINSSVSDMLQWVKLHLDDGKVGEQEIISAAEMRHLHSPQMLMDRPNFAKNPELTDPAYAMGWFIYRYKGLRVVQHGGNIDGFSALVYMLPEKNLGMVILTNQNGAGLPGILVSCATDLLLGLERTDWYARVYSEGDKAKEKEEEKKPEPKRIAGTKPGHAIDDYLGEYEHPAYGVMEVLQTAGGMRLKYNSFDLPMEHWHYDVFRAQYEEMDISMMMNFHSDMNGTIYQLSTSLEPLVDDIVFKKLPPRRLSDPTFLERLAGKYKMEKGDVTATVELRGTVLYATLPGQPTYTLEPFTGTEFKIKDLNGYSVEFHLDGSGKMTSGLSVIQPEGVFKATREK